MMRLLLASILCLLSVGCYAPTVKREVWVECENICKEANSEPLFYSTQRQECGCDNGGNFRLPLK